MKEILSLSSEEAKDHFFKNTSYFNADLPKYINFEPILKDVAEILGGDDYRARRSFCPSTLDRVNYTMLSNKDGRFAWRPLELMHPVIYVSLVNKIFKPGNWDFIKNYFLELEAFGVECCSLPVVSVTSATDRGAQIKSWWNKVEQRSLVYSLEYSHVLHTDVVDCYGSLYAHSIPQALHGIEEAKKKRNDHGLLGNVIDAHIRAGRYGQTNGIAQGNVLMDLVAEVVLGSIDKLMDGELVALGDLKILRYRDDYRVFANNDDVIERALKIISDKLQLAGMKLGRAKTRLCRNVVEGAVRPDKIARIELGYQNIANASTVQKQLLRLHAFGQRFPNSGALKRMLSDYYDNMQQLKETPDDLDVQVAIAADIGFVSPATFPVIAAILSKLISLASPEDKKTLWSKVLKKTQRIPYNGYLEIWLQRVTKTKAIDLSYDSKEALCKIVNGETAQLWEDSWISDRRLKIALDVSRIIVEEAAEQSEVVQPEEIELFKQSALLY